MDVRMDVCMDVRMDVRDGFGGVEAGAKCFAYGEKIWSNRAYHVAHYGSQRCRTSQAKWKLTSFCVQFRWQLIMMWAGRPHLLMIANKRRINGVRTYLVGLVFLSCVPPTSIDRCTNVLKLI